MLYCQSPWNPQDKLLPGDANFKIDIQSYKKDNIINDHVYQKVQVTQID